jgi:hypothetical protein
MTFKNFGCLPADIVNYYHGTEITDYATNSISGSDVILSELDYSEQKILEAIPQGFSSVLQNGIPYVYVFNGQNLGITGIVLSDLHSTTKVDGTGGGSLNPFCGGNGQCQGNLENLYDDTSTVSVSGGLVSIVPSDLGKDYYARMTFTEDTVFGSLKRLVRDLTACRLGSQLFSRGGEDEWVSVKRACEESSEMIKAIKEDPNWMPYELKKLRFFPGTSPIKIKGGISTIKVARS